jgi:choline dehydrogenase-like flavoprotein
MVARAQADGPVSKPSVIIVGSGAGGSVTAWALREAGHPVLILEKGRNLLPGLGSAGPIGSLFSNDEVKEGRYFEVQDPILEPRTSRTQSQARKGVARSFTGDVNDLPTTVGGGTVHWDAKVPRFWRQDFKGRSLHGPVPGANVADWPLTYDELEPFYDEVEARLGVQGDIHRMPKRTLDQAPRRHQFQLPPGDPMYGGALLAEGARRAGHHCYPYPQAIHSKPFGGLPACNNCGFCNGFGCPINARGGAAISFLHEALTRGAELRTRCMVRRVDVTRDGRSARGVTYIDADGREHTARADIVVLAPSAIETARLLLLSANAQHPDGLGNRSGQVGRNLMFHHFTTGVGLFTERIHAWRGPATTFTCDDFVGPVSGRAARKAGLPYFKGGICEVGGGVLLLQEAQLYSELPNAYGTFLKSLLRSIALRDHIAGIQMMGEDVPQLANRVDLDPHVRDFHHLPVPRITYSPHRFELAAANYYAPKLAKICTSAPGINQSLQSLIDQLSGQNANPLSGSSSTKHIMGTARMGDDPEKSVVDRFGRMHELSNVHIADGSVFTTSGGFNPTLTIMALALRAARQIT